MLEPKRSVARLAAFYAGLALVVVAAGLGAYAAWKIGGKADASKVASHDRWHEREIAQLRRGLGDTNLGRLATKYVTEQADAHGYGVSKVLIRRIETDGSEAKVRLSATFTDGYQTQTQELVVVFRRGVWQAQVIEAA